MKYTPGRNVMRESSLTARNGAELTSAANENGNVRIYGTGGTDIGIAILAAVMNANLLASLTDCPVVFKITITNNHSENSLYVTRTLGTGARETISAGETKTITWDWVSDGINQLRFSFSTTTTGAEFDFSYSNAGIYLGTAPEDYRISPEQIITVGSEVANDSIIV